MNPIDEALEVARREFAQFLEPHGTLAVAVGGSVARGEAVAGSDIDLLIFSRTTRTYRKDRAVAQGWKLEIHRIPELLPFHLAKKASPLLEPVPLLNKGETLAYLEGEKSCPLAAPTPKLNSQLAAWRELRKMVDAIPLMQESSWFDNTRDALRHLKSDRTACCTGLATISESAPANFATNAVTALKLDALQRGTAFSKPLWAESYLQARGSVELSQHFSATVLGVEENLVEGKSHLAWLKRMLVPIAELVRTAEAVPLKCDVCLGIPARCNTTRCARDFLNDTEHGIARGWLLGATLSLWSALEYATKRSPSGSEFLNPAWDDFWMNGHEIRRRNLRALISTILEDGT